MKHPEYLVDIAENMEKVRDGGCRDYISGEVQTVPDTLTDRGHRLMPEMNEILSNMNDIYQAGQASAAALKTSVSGAAIAVNDVHEVEHNVGVQLRSKNLFDKNSASIYNNWTVASGGYYTFKVFVGKGNTITVSYQRDLVVNMDCPNTSIVFDAATNGAGTFIYLKTSSVAIRKTLTVIAADDYIYVRSNIYKADELPKFMQYIGNDLQIEISTTATEYEPYIDPVGVEVSRYGKNLCGDNFADYKHDALYGYKYIGEISSIMSSIDKDTSVDCSGCYFGVAFDPNTSTLTNNITWLIQNGVSKNYLSNVVDKRPYLAFYPNNEETLNRMMQRWDIQVELGNTATAYEPYIEPTTYTAKADGTVEGVKSIAPNMTLLSDTSGVIINAEYYKQQ